MDNNLYYILGGIAYGIFILQFIISWVAGEFDVDVDFDVSDVVSFKGFIHFFMGFGGWTSIKQLLGYEVTWIDWLIGFFIGLVFVFMLYHLYKFCMKLQNLPKDEPKTNLVGRTATIYVHLGEGRHLASVNISGALREVEVEGTKKKLLAEAEGKKASLMAEAEQKQAMEMAPALAVEHMIKSGMHPEAIVQYAMTDRWKEVAEANAKVFEHIQLGNVTVYGDSNTAGQFMANMAKNLAPSLEIARNLPIADSLKQIITGKKPEESPAKGDNFPPVK